MEQINEIDIDDMSLVDLLKLNVQLVQAITNKNRELVQQVEDLREANLQLQSCDNWGCKVLEKKLKIAIDALESISNGTLYKEWKSIKAQEALSMIKGLKNG